MGVTIFYRAQLKDEEKIRLMTVELQDIAESMQWPYHVFDEDWSQGPIIDSLDDPDGNPVHTMERPPLKGILFQPHPDSESVYLLFDSAGRLNSMLQLGAGAQEMFDGWVFTKTQFAGAEAHAALVRLFRYLKDKYLPNLEVNDEGNYWHSGDFEELESRINQINAGIEILSQAVEHLPDADRKDPATLLSRIEEIIERLKRK